MRQRSLIETWLRQSGLITLCILLSLGLVVNSAQAAPPSVPTVTTGSELITISNYVSGATLKVYRADGGSPVWQESNVAGPTKTIDLLPYPNSYYVTQVVNGEESPNTPFFNTDLRTPVAVAGVRSIDVTNVSGSTTLELHSVSNGQLISTTVSPQGGGVYRFENVIPDSSLYYIVQSYAGKTSNNTSFLTSRLNTPLPTGGTEYVDVTNVDTDIGATLELYNESGNLVSSSPTYQGSGTYRFSSILPGSGYYVKQSLNGVFAPSNPVKVSPVPPAAPTVTAAVEALKVSEIVVGASLKLYTASGSFLRDVPSVDTTTFTIPDVQPNSEGYKVTQIVGQQESPYSNIANPTLHVPQAAAGVGSIEVTDVSDGAAIHLYDASNDQKLPIEASAQGQGVYRFEPVVPRSEGYYVTQSLFAQESDRTPTVHALLPTPVLTSGIRYVEVGNTYEGATLTLYSGVDAISTQPDSLGGGRYRFSNLDEDTPYHVVQSINGVQSSPSNTVKVEPWIPDAPSVKEMEDAIQVSQFVPGAELRLYSANGTVIQKAENVTDSVYTFSSILPELDAYSVTQTVDSKESPHSAAVNPILRKPAAAGGGESVTVDQVYSGAILKLFRGSELQPLDLKPTRVSDHQYRFDGIVTPGSYSVIQYVGGIASPRSDTVEVTVRSGTGGGSEPAPSLPSIPQSLPPAAVPSSNGQLQKEGLMTESVQEGRTVQTLQVNADFVRALLAAEGKGAILTLPFAGGKADKFVGQLSGVLMTELIRQEAKLVITTPLGSYTLPAAEVPLASSGATASPQAGQAGSDIQIEISIAAASPTDKTQADTLAARNGWTLIQPPVSFEVMQIEAGKPTTVDRFGQYVERTLPLPGSADVQQAVTGVVLVEDALLPVPTRIVSSDKGAVAILSSRTNSTYMLVSSRPELTDIEGNWAAEAIRDLAGRLIVGGTGDRRFEPSRSITRAEFAAILTRSLGLKPGTGSQDVPFPDVSASDWYREAVQTAAHYQLITGLSDGTFRPQQPITRAEAMVMLSRAMAVTGLRYSSDAGAETTLQAFGDYDKLPAWAKQAAVETFASGLFNGQTPNLLAPQKDVTRAETATLIQRLLRASGLI